MEGGREGRREGGSEGGKEGGREGGREKSAHLINSSNIHPSTQCRSTERSRVSSIHLNPRWMLLRW